MATATPLRHPSEGAQNARFYPFTVRISRLNVDGSAAPVLTLPCAYDAATGGVPEEFQDEAPAMDRILIQGWHPTIAAKQTAVLDVTIVRKRFQIADVLPLGIGANGPCETMLLVVPKD